MVCKDDYVFSHQEIQDNLKLTNHGYRESQQMTSEELQLDFQTFLTYLYYIFEILFTAIEVDIL